MNRLGDRWFPPTIPMNLILRMRFHFLTTLATLCITQRSGEERLSLSMGVDLICGLGCGLNAGLRKSSLRRTRGCSEWIETKSAAI